MVNHLQIWFESDKFNLFMNAIHFIRGCSQQVEERDEFFLK